MNNFREHEEKNLGEIFSRYYKYLPLFVLCIVICNLLAFIYIRYFTTPEYYISCTLLIKNSDASFIMPNSQTNTESLGQKKKLGDEIIIFKSKSLMRRVFEELGPKARYFIKGRFKEIEIFEGSLPASVIVNSINSSAFSKSLTIKILSNNQFALLEYNENGEKIEDTYKFGQQIKKTYAEFTVFGIPDFDFSKDIIIRFNNIENLTKHYSNNLLIDLEDENSNVLRLGIKDNIPQRSIDILNKLVEVYNKEAIEDKTQVELNTIEFLDERIQFLSTELSDVEKDVEIYKRDNLLVNVESNAQMYMQTASEYNKELVEIELQLEMFKYLEDYVTQDELNLIPNSLNITDPTIIGLIGKFNEMKLERKRLLRTIQPGSAMIKNLDDQLINLKFNIQETLSNIKNELIIKRNNFKNSSVQFQTKVRSVPSIERELHEFNRQKGIKQAIYLFLLQKREESALSLASAVSSSRIIDSATPSDTPISPNSRNSYIIAFLVGIGLPFAGIYLKVLFNDRVELKEDVERVIEAPILGEIIHSSSKDVLLITEKSRTPIAELFRLITTNLQYATFGSENKIILVTSSMTKEGKTFFSINLAATLVQTGKKVVVVDFDLRKPRLLIELGMTSDIGITNYLIEDKMMLNEIIKPVPQVENLFVIGSGPISPNPAAIIHNSKIGQLISLLKSNFDYVILDTAPVGQVADTFSLAPFIDSTIYLVRYNYTFKAQLKIVQDILSNKKLKNPMVVLNDAKKQNISYGYGYGYKENEETKKGKKVSFLKIW